MSDQIFERIATALEGLLVKIEKFAGGSYTGSADATSSEPAKPAKGGKKAAAIAAGPATATATTGTAPPANVAAPLPASAASSDLMTQAAEAVIDLANNYSRESAVSILAQFDGAKKVSQIKVTDLPKVLAQALAAITAAKAAKANESLV